MSKIQFPLLEVEQSLYELTAHITPNRFIETRPNAVDGQMKDQLLIKILSIRDRGDTYQTARGQIHVFSRDTQGGLLNAPRRDKLKCEVLDLFPIVTDLYHAKDPSVYSAGSDGAGFHSLIIQFNITILKQPLKTP